MSSVACISKDRLLAFSRRYWGGDSKLMLSFCLVLLIQVFTPTKKNADTAEVQSMMR